MSPRRDPELADLENRLREAEETLAAIRSGEVDAVVVSGHAGDYVYTLRGADASYRAMVEQMQEGAVAADRGGLILYANRRFAEMRRQPLEEIIGANLAPIFRGQGGDPLREMLDRPTGSAGIEMSLAAADGTLVPVQVAASPLGLEDAENVFVIVVTDLTMLRQNQRILEAEAELRSLNETLEQQVVERTAMARQQTRQVRILANELAHAEQRERGRLAQVLHDHLQQLLVAASLKVGRLRTRARVSEAAKELAEVEDLMRQAIQASRDLTLELSPPILQEAGLGTALRWLARQMQERHGLAVEVEGHELLGETLEGPHLFLFSAARELLFNVVKHAGSRAARLRVALTADDRICLSVEDDGHGFDSSAVSRRSGGVGLIGIRDRLELLGGSIHVEPGRRGGARVSIVVPVVSGHEEGASEPFPLKTIPSLAAAGPARSRRPARPIRILLVDDHTILRQGLASLLANEPDMETVAEASDGAEAIELTKLLRPDVIVMDASMPGMSGLEATRRIVEKYPRTAVVGLSMYDSEDMSEAMRAAGARAYVTKEKASEDLCDVIRSVLSVDRLARGSSHREQGRRVTGSKM